MTHVSIKCWSNDFNCYERELVYKRELVAFKDGDSVLDQEPAISKAISWLDDMLSAVKDFDFIDELEKLRCKLNQGKNPAPFPTRTSLPIEIVKLMLEKFNLTIDVWETDTRKGGAK